MVRTLIKRIMKEWDLPLLPHHHRGVQDQPLCFRAKVLSPSRQTLCVGEGNRRSSSVSFWSHNTNSSLFVFIWMPQKIKSTSSRRVFFAFSIYSTAGLDQIIIYDNNLSLSEVCVGRVMMYAYCITTRQTMSDVSYCYPGSRSQSVKPNHQSGSCYPAHVIRTVTAQ